MDIQKERKAFSTWGATHPDNPDITAYEEGIMFDAWLAAKSQAVPETKKFNLDEFLVMEQKLKSKGGIIKADLDRFIAYAEMVLEKAKAIKEPK